jgi:hypothetical protein
MSGPTHDVIAAHEAGHAIVAHLLGMRIDVVKLQPDGVSAASVHLIDGSLATASVRDKRLLIFAGMGGEEVGTDGWSGNNLTLDVQMLAPLGAEEGPGGIAAAIALVWQYEPGFVAVRDHLLAVLNESQDLTIGGTIIHALAEGAGVPFGAHAEH